MDEPAGRAPAIFAPGEPGRPSRTGLIKLLPLGGCGANNALEPLAARGFAPSIFRWLGFAYTPYALSSGAARQLFDVCSSEPALSDQVRMLAYDETHQPGPSTRHLVEASEIALVELSTPIEPLIGDGIVNFNRIFDSIILPLRRSSTAPKLLSDWTNALVNVREDLKERAGALLANWPADLVDDGTARFGVEALRSRRLEIDDMVRDLESVRERLGAPMALKLYNFRYMPDGRAIDWPAGFKSQQFEVARRMGLPTLDFGPIVERFGPARTVVDEDAYNHLRPESHGVQAELIYDFLAVILDRPFLDSHPEWRESRRELNRAFPELIDQPARWSFPEVASFPEGKMAGGASERAWTAPIAADRPDPGRPPAYSPSRLAAQVNAALIALHRARLDAMGPRESGLEAHYVRLLERNLLVGEREKTTLRLIDDYLPAYDVYAVMRAGLGELALLLAASGRAVIAFEPDRRRRAAIEDGRARLETMGLAPARALTVIDALTPPAELSGRVLGVGLDVAHVASEAAVAPHLVRMSAFAALLIEPRLFLRRRESLADQALAAQSLRAIGFEDRRDFPGAALSWFDRKAEAGI
jgi:hypothetical protein